MAPSLLCREGAWLERGEIVAKTLQLLTMTDLALEARALEHVEKSLLDFTVAICNNLAFGYLQDTESGRS